jgi:hypothetical protein
MKNVIFVFAFVAAVSAFAYPPVAEPNGNDSPSVLYNTDDGTYVEESDEVSGSWPVPRPNGDEDVSVWIGMTDEADDGTVEPEVFGNIYAADPDEGESDMYMSYIFETEEPDGTMTVAEGWGDNPWCRGYILCRG